MASKRNRGLAGSKEKPKMTATEYHDLIGQHEHIEHKALRHEVAKEFAKFSQRKNLRSIQTNEFLNPPQPPALPLETNHSSKAFRRAAPWPAYSLIQKAAHMLQFSVYEEKHVIAYLQSIPLPPEKIEIAQEVSALMEQCHCYWRKLHHVKPYQARYNCRTRRYSLQHAPWPLQIAMTLMDFHLDHIVDIVYHKPIWSRDHDAYMQQRRERIRKPQLDENRNYDSAETASCDEYEQYEYEDLEEEEEVGSEDEAISPLVNQVADHMTVQQLENIRDKVKQQNNQTLEDLFSNVFANLAEDGKKIAFADDFEMDLGESDHGNENEEEKAEFEMKKEDSEQDEMVLNRLYAKYPAMDRKEVRQTFMQQNKQFETTIFQLDHLESQTNAFHNK